MSLRQDATARLLGKEQDCRRVNKKESSDAVDASMTDCATSKRANIVQQLPLRREHHNHRYFTQSGQLLGAFLQLQYERCGCFQNSFFNSAASSQLDRLYLSKPSSISIRAASLGERPDCTAPIALPQGTTNQFVIWVHVDPQNRPRQNQSQKGYSPICSHVSAEALLPP